LRTTLCRVALVVGARVAVLAVEELAHVASFGRVAAIAERTGVAIVAVERRTRLAPRLRVAPFITVADISVRADDEFSYALVVRARIVVGAGVAVVARRSVRREHTTRVILTRVGGARVSVVARNGHRAYAALGGVAGLVAVADFPIVARERCCALHAGSAFALGNPVADVAVFALGVAGTATNPRCPDDAPRRGVAGLHAVAREAVVTGQRGAVGAARIGVTRFGAVAGVTVGAQSVERTVCALAAVSITRVLRALDAVVAGLRGLRNAQGVLADVTDGARFSVVARFRVGNEDTAVVAALVVRTRVSVVAGRTVAYAESGLAHVRRTARVVAIADVSVVDVDEHVCACVAGFAATLIDVAVRVARSVDEAGATYNHVAAGAVDACVFGAFDAIGALVVGGALGDHHVGVLGVGSTVVGVVDVLGVSHGRVVRDVHVAVVAARVVGGRRPIHELQRGLGSRRGVRRAAGDGESDQGERKVFHWLLLVKQ